MLAEANSEVVRPVTLKALPEYERPVPAVVVAELETSPPKTESPPFERVGRLKVELMVEEAVERKPPVNPRMVEVETP